MGVGAVVRQPKPRLEDEMYDPRKKSTLQNQQRSGQSREEKESVQGNLALVTDVIDIRQDGDLLCLFEGIRGKNKVKKKWRRKYPN